MGFSWSLEVFPMRVFRFLALSVALLSVAFPAFASSDKKLPPIPLPIQNLVDEGAQIRYLGRDNGLDGWVTMKQGQQQYFYVTQDQQSIIMGVLFNAKGDAVTLRQVNELRTKEGPAIDILAGFPPPTRPDDSSSAALAAPDFNDPASVARATAAAAATSSKSDQLYAAVTAANWISLGRADAPVIYSFIDPECQHCHDLIQDVRKSGLLEKGQVQLRLLPVGIISEESLQEAAYLLAAPNAAELLYQHLDGKPGVLLADPSVNTQGVQRNMALMQDWKFDVTPFSIYKDTSGKVKILRGRPNDLKKVVAELR
jgi:thiol:disulfide interchange protein DsbG